MARTNNWCSRPFSALPTLYMNTSEELGVGHYSNTLASWERGDRDVVASVHMVCEVLILRGPCL